MLEVRGYFVISILCLLICKSLLFGLVEFGVFAEFVNEGFNYKRK